MKRGYTAITTYGDFGPWISKLVLELPAEVSSADVSPAAFSVYCERVDGAGEVVSVVERPALSTHPSRGYVPVIDAYACDASGARVARGTHAAIKLPECELTGRINVVSVAEAEYIENRFVVTQTAPVESSGARLLAWSLTRAPRSCRLRLRGGRTAGAARRSFRLSTRALIPITARRTVSMPRPRWSSGCTAPLTAALTCGCPIRPLT